MLHHFELCWHACGRRAASSVAYASKQKQSPRLFSRNAIVPGNKCNLATVDLIKDFFFLTKTDNSTIAANTGQISLTTARLVHDAISFAPIGLSIISILDRYKLYRSFVADHS